jgi:hypothetical protein
VIQCADGNGGEAKIEAWPKAEVLKLEGDWRANIAKAITKPKPAGEWPKPK